jgi:hypothetical protein
MAIRVFHTYSLLPMALGCACNKEHAKCQTLAQRTSHSGRSLFRIICNAPSQVCICITAVIFNIPIKHHSDTRLPGLATDAAMNMLHSLKSSPNLRPASPKIGIVIMSACIWSSPRYCNHISRNLSTSSSHDSVPGGRSSTPSRQKIHDFIVWFKPIVSSIFLNLYEVDNPKKL